MILERRDFLKLLGGTTGALALGSCGRFQVPDRLVELALRGPGIETQLNTICGLCESGCGVTTRLVDGLPVGLKGNRRHPLNRGGLCPVGQTGLEILYAPNRLQTPLRRQMDGSFQQVDWDEALTEIAARLTELLNSRNAHRVALLHGEPGELFDDLAARFVHALGSPNIVRVGAVDALPYRLAQGIDSVPGFDLEQSDLVLSVGLDLFEDGPAPLHAISSMVGSRATPDRARLIHVGSRLSPSATKAEQRIPVRPGTHAAAALGIAHVLVREGRYDRRFVDEQTFGFEDWTDEEGQDRLGFRRLLLERYYPDRAANLAGCDPGRIIRAARRLARARAPVAICGGEATEGVNATWTVLAVHALNALLGAFDRPGGVVMPPTIPFTPLEPLPETGEGIFATDGDTALGRDPVEALANADELEVLFITGTNPVHDSPAGERLSQTLERVPFVVALASFQDETASCADLILPRSLFLETWQESTTPSGVAASILGISQPVVEPFFDTRHPGDVLLELARRTGGDATSALPWPSYEAYLGHRLEGLLISGQGSVISGSFEESWVHFLEERGWRFLERGDRKAFWNDLTRQGGWWNPVVPRQDWDRLFTTDSGRYEFFSLELEKHLRRLGGELQSAPGGDPLQRGIEALGLEALGDEACLPHFEPPPLREPSGKSQLTLVPFRPITSRGALGVASPMLLEMYGYYLLSGWETWVELAPETGHELDVEEGDWVALESERGHIEAIVKIEPGTTPGTAHVALGLGRRELGGASEGIGANPLDLVLTERDPVSGSLATAGTPVTLQLVRRRPRGGPRPLYGEHA